MYLIENLVTRDDFRHRFAKVIDRPADSLGIRSAKIKVTARCNLRCRMCRYWQRSPGPELDTNAIAATIRRLEGLGCRKVHFSGGEPFLREDFLDILHIACGTGMKVNLTTNGTLLDSKRIKHLFDLKINSISFSLDGPSAALHDGIRGMKGSFKRLVRVLEKVRGIRDSSGSKTKIRLNVVLQSRNFRALPELIRLAGSLGATEVHPLPVDEKGRRKNCLSKTEIKEFNAEVVPRALEERKRLMFGTSDDLVYPYGKTKSDVNYSKDGLYARGFYADRICFVPWLHMFIAWDGSVYTCCMMNGRMEPLGNAAKSDVGEVFEGEAYRNLRSRFVGERFESCGACDDFLKENELLNACLNRMASS